MLKKIEGWSFRLFGGLAPYFLKHIRQLKGTLDRALIRIYPEAYVSLMFFIAAVTIPVSAISLFVTIHFGFLPALIMAPFPLYVMAVFMLAPMSKASDRATGVEREIPFAAAYISVMASGGIAPYNSFKRLSEINLMPSMRIEAREITKDVEIFGTDPLTAIEVAAKKNPNDIFRDFLSGYASTVIIGGDIGHFLERKAEEIFRARALRVKAAAERLGMLLETFVIVMVMMSLCFYIMFSVQSIYSTGATGTYSTMIMYTYVFMPMLSVLFIYLAHSMQPKSPSTDMRPYKVFGVCSIIAIVVFLLLTNFMGIISVPFLAALSSVIDLPIAITVALVVATAPAAILHMKYSKQQSGIESGINNFLRDLTEVRKTGLSPEKCIESLAKRDYGVFSKELRKISAEISWGIPLKKVIMQFISRTRSWMTQLVMFLLVETIDVGGGTIGMIESLARFNNLTQEVEKEKKMSTRPYVMMPYLSAILLVGTTTMMMAMSSGAITGITSASSKDLGQMSLIFNTSVIFQSYLIGIVAGKISEESVAAGFKHASILVIIALVASKLVPLFIHV